MDNYYYTFTDTWIFECSVMGTGFTIWNGSVFHCPSSNNKIILFHTRYNMTGGIERSCNNEQVMILGQSIGVSKNVYTSRITITSKSELIRQSIECRYDDGNTNRRVVSFMNSNDALPGELNL